MQPVVGSVNPRGYQIISQIEHKKPRRIPKDTKDTTKTTLRNLTCIPLHDVGASAEPIPLS